MTNDKSPGPFESKCISNSPNGPDLRPDKSVFIGPLIENVLHLHIKVRTAMLCKRTVIVKRGIRFDRGIEHKYNSGGSRDRICILAVCGHIERNADTLTDPLCRCGGKHVWRLAE